MTAAPAPFLSFSPLFHSPPEQQHLLCFVYLLFRIHCFYFLLFVYGMERRLVDGGGLKKMRKSDRCGSDCGRVRDCEKDSAELVEKVSYWCVYPLKNEVSPLKYPPKSTPLPLTHITINPCQQLHRQHYKEYGHMGQSSHFDGCITTEPLGGSASAAASGSLGNATLLDERFPNDLHSVTSWFMRSRYLCD
jgi:hypothetical protein